MHRIYIGICILSLAIPVSAREIKGNLAEDRVSILLPHNSHWSLCVVDAGNGEEVLSVGNSVTELLTTGSLIKLFVSGAILEVVSPDLNCTVAYDGSIVDGVLAGNIYLRGKGNAFLSAADLRRAAGKVSLAGIKAITGSIVADDTFFDTDGFRRTRKGPGYAAVSALGLDLHTLAVTVSPSETGKPPKVNLEPSYDGMRMAVSAMTTKTAATTLRVIQLDDVSYRITGNIPTNSGPLKWRFALADPALFAGGVFRTLLHEQGIRGGGEVRKGKTPTSTKVIVEIPGPPIRQLLREMNFHSLNVVADNLLLTLGACGNAERGTKEKGLKAVTEFLSLSGLPMNEVKMADGSGLSSENRATAHFMALYLAKVAGKPWFGDFYNSLPRTGIEGTAANIGYRNEKFRIKTGILEDVFALAGFGADGKGRDIAFAYIVNVPGGGVMNLERSGAEVMKLLSELK
jgi:D-alanyl-D-alanine carboxypeptidase/D-alanyl-D-alanine-endopeptidase (penicillin-binding protein 4)